MLSGKNDGDNKKSEIENVQKRKANTKYISLFVEKSPKSIQYKSGLKLSNLKHVIYYQCVVTGKETMNTFVQCTNYKI